MHVADKGESHGERAPDDDRSRVPDTARRVLVAVHGREPAGWELAVCRALTLSPQPAVRVLAVADAPSTASAALLPFLLAGPEIGPAPSGGGSRRRPSPGASKALRAGLSVVPEVVWAHVVDADPGRTIVERAAVWGAGLIVVGVDGTSWPERRLLGAVHERVVARAGCVVLVMPPAERGTLRWEGRGIRVRTRWTAAGYREGRALTRMARSFRSASTGGCTRPSPAECCSSSSRPLPVAP